MTLFIKVYITILVDIPLHFKVVGLGRLELPTSPLSGVRSNQLSYKPIVWLGQISGGAKQDRTADLLRARQALSQLSYSPIICNMLSLVSTRVFPRRFLPAQEWRFFVNNNGVAFVVDVVVCSTYLMVWYMVSLFLVAKKSVWALHQKWLWLVVRRWSNPRFP